MECRISKIMVPVYGEENDLQEMYIYVYHTGDELLDKMLHMYGDTIGGDAISCNVEISYYLRDHTKSHNLHFFNYKNSVIEVYSDHVKIVSPRCNVKLVTKEEFAILKTLLSGDIKYWLLFSTELEYFVHYDDIICGLSVTHNNSGYFLKNNYLNTKYSFSYTHMIQLPFAKTDAESIVKFFEIIDNFIVTPNSIVEKLKKVQIYLVTEDGDIPCYFPRFQKYHKLIIENTFKLMESLDDLNAILHKYITDDVKLDGLLPNGIKKA
jgi:hypothetical protein